MSLITYLILLVVTGLIVGGLARLALPGPDPMSIPQTIGIGIGGNLLAGLVSLAIFDGESTGGLILSIAFATLLVYLVRRSRGQGLDSTRRRPGSMGRLGA
jgi:uncharacterized membrane protein YeaQ/YmgE (transglycosylase-associated protein family)